MQSQNIQPYIKQYLTNGIYQTNWTKVGEQDRLKQAVNNSVQNVWNMFNALNTYYHIYASTIKYPNTNKYV